MPERRMAEVVGEGNGLGEIGIEPERLGDIARNGGDFHGVGEPRAEVIAGAVEEDLGLVFEAAEGAGMDDAIAIALVLRAPFGRRFDVFASARIAAELRVRRERLAFDLFKFLPRSRHGRRLRERCVKSNRKRGCMAATDARRWRRSRSPFIRLLTSAATIA